ncbi:uncharacterized protein LOC132546349 [Ylistrum balloti]|uniref:uncharacterized protein LOC132546349 n=1 Tax=Ylistrum balloti TaxID=509963 RepID=UPI002905C7C1|nr:uncharacterized protein LOC132546349 [Ylistrum balloti]
MAENKPSLLADTSDTHNTTVPSPGPVGVTEGTCVGVDELTDTPDTSPDGFRDTLNKRVKTLVRGIKRGSTPKPIAKPEVTLVEECPRENNDDDEKSSSFDNDSTGNESEIETQSDIANFDSPNIWERRKLQNMLDDIYDFNHFRRGVAVLIVNTEFSNIKDNRPSAKHDIKNLTELFQVLDFYVILLQNKTTSDLRDSLIEIQSKLEEDSDCFACLISTHGAEAQGRDHNIRQHVLHTYDGMIPTDEIVSMFNDSNCAAMRGKPKLFFIQACRGRYDTADTDMVDDGVEIDIMDVVPPFVMYPGGEGHDVSYHQGQNYSDECTSTHEEEIEQEEGHRGTSFEIRTKAESITKQEAHGNTGEDDFKNTTKSDAKGRPDDDIIRMQGLEHIPFVDDIEKTDDEQEQRKNREACRRYQEQVQREEERKRLERKLALQLKWEIDFCSIPCYNHCLVMFSSAPERFAWCDDHIGGWLPYCMYNVVCRLHRYDFQTDFLQVLTEVNHEMAVYLKTNTPSKPELHQTKSAACIYHMLTKDIYFRLKWNRNREFVTEV